MKFIKCFPLLICLFLPGILFGQVPAGYYDAAEGKSGEELKTALNGIIKGHTEYPYTSSSTDVWDILKETDIDPSNSDNVTMFYTGWFENAALEYDNGQGWSREHVWAKSHGDFGTSKGPGTDVHHLRAADVTVNSARNNKDFDNGGDIYVDGDGTTECRTDSDSWEPRDEVKGDVARMLFYMAVRYEGEDGEPDLELVDEVNTVDLNEPNKGYHGKLSALLEWHVSDPVDDTERNRNDVIYSYQHNRNPFIDYPEYVAKIWETTGLDIQEAGTIKIYPNPAEGFVTIEVPGDVESFGKIYSVTGQVLMEFEIHGKIKLYTNDIKQGTYLIKLETEEQVFQSQILILN